MTAGVAADVEVAKLARGKLDRRENRTLGTAGAKRRLARPDMGCHALRRAVCGYVRGTLQLLGEKVRPVAFEKAHHPRLDDAAGIFAGQRQHALAFQASLFQTGLRARAGEDRVQALLDEFGLAFLDREHGALAFAKAQDLAFDQRIGDVENVDRHLGFAERIGEPHACSA